MVDQQDYGNAFQVLNYILGTLGTVDMDDSDGGTGYLADEIYETGRRFFPVSVTRKRRRCLTGLRLI